MATLGYIGTPVDLKIKQGSSLALPFSAKDDAGNIIDLTGYIVRSQIRKTRLASVVTQPFTATITDASNGLFVLSLTATQTGAIACGETPASPVSQYVWDLEMQSPAGFVTPLAYGAVVVFPEVTR